MFVELRERIRNGSAMTEFPTRVEVAARNADLMFACYASALGGGRVALPVSLPDAVVDKLDALTQPPDFSKSDRVRERPRRVPPTAGQAGA